VAPQGAVAGNKADHPQALREVLQTVWPSQRPQEYLRVVRNRAELENALHGLLPQLIYVYALGAVGTDRQPGLLLDGERGEDLLPLRWLADRLKRLSRRPALLYLNVAGLTGASVKQVQSLLDDLPLLIWRRVPSRSEADTTQAVHWLRRWLERGTDPVTALHQIGLEENTLTAAAELTVHSNYRSWKTLTRPNAWQQRYAHLKLDRDEQKALVGKHLDELINSGSRRVMALVAYAAPGNRLSHLHEALRDYLEGSASKSAEVNWRNLQFPLTRQNLLRDLEHELQQQLTVDGLEYVEHLLRRHAPTVVGTGKQAVLWLNWGVFGSSQDCQPALTTGQVANWLRFAGEFLCQHCPDDLRIVSFAALELDAEKHHLLRKTLDQERWQPWCDHPTFRLDHLPALGEVTPKHLYDYLSGGESNCPPSVRREITGLLIEKTSGEFESTVKLIQEAEDGSWNDLLLRLRREQDKESPRDDQLL
jgi:hypothetical protein